MDQPAKQQHQRRSTFDVLLQQVSLQAELAATVKVHDEAINDLGDRIDGCATAAQVSALTETVATLATREDARAAAREIFLEMADPWWKKPLENIASTVVASVILGLLAALSGHLRWH